jgi:hypothetical protein
MNIRESLQLFCSKAIFAKLKKYTYTVLPRLSEVFWDNLTEIHIIENSLNRINEYDTKRKNDKSF